MSKNLEKGISFSEEDGHQLAADMLREIQQHWRDREKGVPDHEIVTLWRRERSPILRRYLAKVKESSSSPLKAGFFAVLTDVVGSECSPYPEYYEQSGEANRQS